jgi:hypothetical protein
MAGVLLLRRWFFQTPDVGLTLAKEYFDRLQLTAFSDAVPETDAILTDSVT